MARLSVLVPGSLLVLVLGAALVVAGPARANGILVERPSAVAVPEEPVRLVAHRVSARVDDVVAAVSVEQTFRSLANVPLEGTYLFPVPEGASVSGFAMTVGDRVLHGEVLDAARAREVYERIVRARRDPGLLEWVGRGLFRARVFPIEPGKDVTVRLRYEQVLDTAGTLLHWTYPLAATRLHPRAPEQVVLDVTVESASDLQAVYSPSHDVAVSREGARRARVTYEGGSERRDRDFSLFVGRGRGEIGFSLLSHKPAGEDGTFLAVISPSATPADEEVVPRDVVFVLDTSGSMSGTKLEQAKEALIEGIRMLREDDRFGVVAFASEVVPFRGGGAAPATPEAKEAAIRWVRGRAALGGTDIAGALTEALRRLAAGRLPFVVLLTDGRPTVGSTRTEDILAAVARTNGAAARVHTFGLGHDLDVALLDRIAEATRGSRDYVAPQEEVRSVTSRFFRRVDRPVWRDVEVELPEGAYDVVPRRVGDLFAGEQVVLLGRYREAGGKTFRLKGAAPRGGAEVVRDFHGALTGASGLDVLPRLFAQRKVAYLLDEVRLHGASKEVTDEITALATRHGIVTPYTAGLVVEDGDRVSSQSPLSQIGGRGPFRGPSTGVPPGLRPPSDPTPPPPPPASGGGPTTPPMGLGMPPSTPTPPRDAEVEESKRLRDAKRGAHDRGDAAAVGTVREVAGKSFRRERDGRWTDTTYDGKAETRKVEAYSDAWLELSRKDRKVARWLAVGERLVFVHEGVAYEVVPAAKR